VDAKEVQFQQDTYFPWRDVSFDAMIIIVVIDPIEVQS
jgi:hypothetical protein